MGIAPSLLLPALTALWILAVTGVGMLVVVGPTLRRQRQTKRRIAGLTRHRARAAAVADSRAMKLAGSGAPKGLDQFFGRLLPRRDMLVLRLERTGRSISVTRYLAISTALWLIVTGISARFIGLGLLPDLLCGTLVGIGLPHYWVGRMGRKRVAKFMMLLPEAIDLMVRALRSGLPISEAIVNAGHEVADPVGAEFRRVESALRLGRELDDVLWDTARRLDVAEFRFFVISMGVQRETGGNLAETLATLSEMLRRRQQMKLKIKALSAEGRTSAFILGGLPFAVCAIMTFTSPEYVGRLFQDPRGLILCGIGLVLMAIGAAVMAKIINFEI
jgi:tight adherence protein B